MSSLQGYNTEFSSIADNFLYLTLTPEDKEYLTNIQQKTFKFLGANEPDRVPNDKKLEYLKFVTDMQAKYQTLQQYQKPDPRKSILETIKAINVDGSLSDIIQLIETTNYDVDLKAKRLGNVNGTTFFAFVNGSKGLIDNWVAQWRPDDWNSNKSLTYKRELLKHHTLPFVLLPGQIENKRLQVATLLSDYISVYNKFDIEYLNNQAVINYSGRNYLLDGEGYYPTSFQRIKILQAVSCTDGIVYIIEKPVMPIIF
jgi:hypothetical protein